MVGGYFDLFLAFLDNAVENGFISALNRQIVVTASTARELLDKMEAVEVAKKVF